MVDQREIAIRQAAPEHGQQILFRRPGRPHYVAATWNDRTQQAVTADGQRTSRQFIYGWLPAGGATSFLKRLQEKAAANG